MVEAIVWRGRATALPMSKLTDRSLSFAPLMVTLGLLLGGSAADAASARGTDQDAAFEALLDAPEDHRGLLAEDFLDRFGETASDSRVATAHSIVGDMLWRASCAERKGDLCVEVHNPQPRPDSCAAPRRGEYVPIARDPEKAGDAKVHLRAAAELAGAEVPANATEARRFRTALGRAQVQLADADLETFLGLQAPEMLDGEDEESAEAFRTYYTTLTAQGAALTKAYAAVKGSGDLEWIITAAVRTGMVMETPAEALGAIAMPPGLGEAQVEAYCEQIDAYIEPTREHARGVYQWCIDRAEREGVELDAVQTCRDRLDALTDEG